MTEETYLRLSHRYEQAAAAAGDSYYGSLNEYNFTNAAKYYELAQGNLINAQTLNEIIEGPLTIRLGASGYFGAEEQVNAVVEAGGSDFAEAGLNSLGGLGGAAAIIGGGRVINLGGTNYSFPARTSRNDPTMGYLVLDAGEVIPVPSGVKGFAEDIPQGTPGFNGLTKTHSEGHAAAYMRKHNIKSATLYINNN